MSLAAVSGCATPPLPLVPLNAPTRSRPFHRLPFRQILALPELDFLKTVSWQRLMPAQGPRHWLKQPTRQAIPRALSRLAVWYRRLRACRLVAACPLWVEPAAQPLLQLPTQAVGLPLQQILEADRDLAEAIGFYLPRSRFTVAQHGRWHTV